MRRILISFCLLLSAMLFAAAQSQRDPALAAQLAKARNLMLERRYDDAVVEYKRADEMAEGKSYWAALGLAEACRDTQDYLQAEEAALRAAAVGANKLDKANAYWNAAMASMWQAEKMPAKYADAEREFREVLQLRPESGPYFTRYYLGRIYLRQRRDEDGIAQLKAYLAEAEQDSSVTNKQNVIEYSRQLIEDPSLGHARAWGPPSAPTPTEKRNAIEVAETVKLPDSADPKVREHFNKGVQLMRSDKYEDAIKELKTANKLALEKYYEVLLQLAVAYEGVGAHKNAVETALRAAGVAATDAEKASAHACAGVSLIELGQDKAEKYKDAEREFRTALQLNPNAEFGHFNLAMTLFRQSRDAEGQAEMKLYADEHPYSARVAEAKKIAADPRRAREVFVPDFSLTTMDGEYLSTEELAGKVVVLDFWASWCGPCRMSLGDLRSFSKHFAGKPVVLISISADNDEDTWRSFVQKNDMKWPQYYDKNGKIRSLFKINAFPSYLVIDGEGIVRRKVIGAGGFQINDVEAEVKKGLKKIEQAQKAKSAAASGE